MYDTLLILFASPRHGLQTKQLKTIQDVSQSILCNVWNLCGILWISLPDHHNSETLHNKTRIPNTYDTPESIPSPKCRRCDELCTPR